VESWTEDDLRAREWAEKEQAWRARWRRLAGIEARLDELERRMAEMERAVAPITETAARFAPVA